VEALFLVVALPFVVMVLGMEGLEAAESAGATSE